MENFLMLFIVVAVIITMIFFISSPKRRNRKKEKLVASALLTLNFALITGIITTIGFVFFFYFFIERLTVTYEFLINQQLIDNIFDLFDKETMENLQNYYYENEKIREFYTIVRFRNDGIKYLINSMIMGLSSISFIYQWLERNAICKDGIYNNNIKINWDQIIGYEWGEYREGRTFEGYRRYYNLIILSKRSKFDAWLLAEDTNEIKLRIMADDKHIVDSLLQEIVGTHQAK